MDATDRGGKRAPVRIARPRGVVVLDQKIAQRYGEGVVRYLARHSVGRIRGRY
jgi:hypothetical protein